MEVKKNTLGSFRGLRVRVFVVFCGAKNRRLLSRVGGVFATAHAPPHRVLLRKTRENIVLQ